MSQLVASSNILGAVYLSALPLFCVDRRVLVEALPPNGVVIEVTRNVGEDGALLGGDKSVRVGLHVRAGSDAEEAVFRVDGIQSAIRTLAHPSDVVADGPDLVALCTVAFRRNHHSQVGLAASRRECSANVLNLALRVLNAEDEHVLCHPAFVLSLIGSDTQSEALLAEQNVAAVSGVYGDDGVVFRELADPALLRVNVALAVQTANPVVAVAENVHDLLTDSGHDGHVENNIDGVCQLNADLSERGTDRAHGVRDNVHGTALVAATSNIVQHLVCFLRLFPVVGRACVLFFSGADEGSVLNTGNIIRSCSVIVAARELFLIQLDHFAGLNRFLAELFELLFGAVDPNNLIRIDKSFHLVDPSKNCLVVSHCYFSFRQKGK